MQRLEMETRGAQVIIRTVTALKSGNVSSRDVSQAVLVALRDQLCVHEGALTAPSSQSVAPQADDQHKVGRLPKNMQEAFRSVVGTQEDPRCSEALHQCLTQTGFSAATWLTPRVKEAVRNAVGTLPDSVYYAKLVSEFPPDSRLTSLDSEGVRLGVWTLLCKLGGVLLSYQLAHENAHVPAETLVKLMLDDASERSNKSIVSFLAGHTRALSIITGAQQQTKRVPHQSFSGPRPQSFVPRPQSFVPRPQSFASQVPLRGMSVKKTWPFPNAPEDTCRHCGKRGHRMSECRVPEASVLRTLNRDKGKVRPGNSQH